MRQRTFTIKRETWLWLQRASWLPKESWRMWAAELIFEWHEYVPWTCVRWIWGGKGPQILTMRDSHGIEHHSNLYGPEDWYEYGPLKKIEFKKT